MLEREGRSRAAIQQKSLDTPDEVRRFPKGIVDLVHIGSVTIGRGILEPGFRWVDVAEADPGNPLVPDPSPSADAAGALPRRDG